MRLPRVRITIRVLMIATAGVGLLLGAALNVCHLQFRLRRAQFGADLYGELEASFRVRSPRIES